MSREGMNPGESRVTYFDPHEAPLSGVNLVEASAGTGKTYALSGLYVRLLVERGLSTREILVVTFTKAATEELKGRIRSRIRDALRAFSTGRVRDDDFLTRLIARVTDHEQARRFLVDALRSFDEAAVFTIHGFCLRTLHNHAFESGSLFDTELIEDEHELFRELLNDFWRVKFYESPKQFFSSIRRRVTPEKLERIVWAYRRNPVLSIRGGEVVGKAPADELLEKTCEQSFASTAKSWGSFREEVIRILREGPALNRAIYNPGKVSDVIEKIDAYFTSGYYLPRPDALDHLCFDSPVKQSAIKKNQTAPEHPFFRECEVLRKRLREMEACYDQKVVELRKELIDFIGQESVKRKREQNVRSFSDLLSDVHDALEGEGGERLAGSLRARYRAGLIDEFQDTDPLQYAIFKKIFSYPEATLYLIGDPKQSIYGFRGADLFSYIKASHTVSEHFTLEENWRSSQPLITAINTIFDRPGHPFVLDALQFFPVRAGDKKRDRRLTFDGEPDASPFKLWFLRRDEGDRDIGIEAARTRLYRNVSGEVVRLLELGRSRTALLDGQPVHAGDIAILVRTNKEAQEIQVTLRELNVPSVVYSNASVFSSNEAQELERVLLAISDPTDDGLARVALATSIMGMTGDALAAMLEDETSWERLVTKFEEYRDIWQHEGFITMARTLVAREKVKQRLRTHADGDRRLTNVLHCLELLHRASIEEKLGIEGLLKWLSEKRRDTEDAEVEEHQIRLETDEKAVKIVTIHKAKGLEYPICFCPFLWGKSTVPEDLIMYHNAEKEHEPTLDISLSADDGAKRCADREALSENIRLAYVALTRAKYRCYMAWGRIAKSETSALAYVLHGGSAGTVRDTINGLGELADRVVALTDEQMEAGLKELAGRAEGAIEVLDTPDGRARPYRPAVEESTRLSPKRFRGRIERDWKISSFSALTSRKEDPLKEELVELPDRDMELAEKPFGLEMAESTAGPEPRVIRTIRTIYDFPRGTRAGSCLHDIFEHLDFSRWDRADGGKELEDVLVRWGFGAEWSDVAADMVQNVLTAALPGADGPFMLSCLEQKERLHELEFYVPMELITAKGLSSLFMPKGGTHNSPSFAQLIRRLNFSPVRGMLKGFIDLVFRHNGRYYLVDWKSNYLGGRVEDYAFDRLVPAMEREFYTLQYHIYCVALHRFLGVRLKEYAYDTHFGGIFYLFLRGIDGERPGYGIYADRPERSVVESFARYVTGSGTGSRTDS
jgi:exodeoxyribonuclease V beta subunit